jgi:hypothetical protein
VIRQALAWALVYALTAVWLLVALPVAGVVAAWRVIRRRT